MSEFTKSMLNFPWAMSLFGVEQMAKVLIQPTTAKADASLDSITQMTGEQLGETIQSLYLLGDNLQREATDTLFGLLSSRHLHSPNGGVSGLMQQSADILNGLNPAQNGPLTLQEIKNKITVFSLVRNVKSQLQLPATPPFPPLLEAVDKAYALAPYPSLWVVEGLGHWYGDTFYIRGEVPQGILRHEHLQALPAKSLTMLHAGIGMAIAQHWMKTINHLSPVADICHALQQVMALCRDNSRLGYEGAALESLGLITRNGQFYNETRPDEMVRIVSRELERIDPEGFDYFWRGVGRAHYFLPIHFIPGYGSNWHAVGMLRQAVPNQRAWLNAIAGLAWGITMVNIRHPEILAGFLAAHGKQLAADDGFANGVASSIIMRYDTTPHEPFIPSFYQYPAPGSEQIWQAFVRQPCEVALGQYYPVLTQHQRLGEVFRYQSLGALVAQLQRAESAPGTV